MEKITRIANFFPDDRKLTKSPGQGFTAPSMTANDGTTPPAPGQRNRFYENCTGALGIALDAHYSG
jgi:hypothetical protein